MKQFINPQELFIILGKKAFALTTCGPEACGAGGALSVRNKGGHNGPAALGAPFDSTI